MSTTRRTIYYRRKRAGKTNYKKRLELLKSRKQRFVIRKTNTSLILQVVEYTSSGDRVVVGLSSKKLKDYGWKHSAKNLPAAYLSGLLLGKLSLDAGVKEAILDLGLQTPVHGSKVYAALKGVKDAGLSVPHTDAVYPSDERVEGKHLKNDVSKDFAAAKQKILGVTHATNKKD